MYLKREMCCPLEEMIAKNQELSKVKHDLVEVYENSKTTFL